MNSPFLRLTGAVLLIALGIWAGASLHSSRGPAPSISGVPVAAGRASPPNPSDLAHADATPGVVVPGTTAGEDAVPGSTADDAGAPPPRARIPDLLPAFSLADRNGKQTAIAAFAGRSLIINFWATWCAPCRQEIPLLQKLRRQYRADGLEIVGIAVDFGGAVRDYMAQTPISYPILIGEDQGMMAAGQFGMQLVLPFSVFALPDGRILIIKVGELHQDEADDILQMQQSVVAGKMDLPQARATLDGLLQGRAVERARAAGAH
jgi:thiol-disulfide isomerase/thioredoxin